MLTAVENRFLASHVLRHGIKSVEHVESELFPLLIFGDANLLNMADNGAILDTIVIS